MELCHPEVTPLDEKRPSHDYDPPVPKFQSHGMFDVGQSPRP